MGATAHAQLIADLDDSGVTAALGRIESGMESSTLNAVRSFQKMEQEAERYGVYLDKLLAKELAAAAKINEALEQEGSAIARVNQAREKMRAGLMSERAARGGGGQNLDMQDRLAGVQNAGVVDKSKGGTGASFAYRSGQVALQAQDIAVQLESGTSAARVLVQQGSQLASIFGTKGAIYGGLIAIGITVAEWLNNTKKIAAENKLIEDSVKAQAEVGQRLMKGADDANEEARIARRRNALGDEAADELKRQIEHEKKIQQIRHDFGGPGSGFEEAENRRYDEVEKGEAEKQMIERVKKHNDELKEQAGLEKQLRDLRNNEKGQSPQQKLHDLSSELQQVRDQQRGTHGMEYLQKEVEAMQLRSQIVKTAQEDNERLSKSYLKLADDIDHAKGAADMMAHTVAHGLHEIVRDFKTAVEKELTASAATAIAKSLTDGASLLQAADKIMNPKAYKDMERQGRRENRAIREAAERSVNQDEHQLRRRGLRDLSPAERKKAVEDRIASAHNARHEGVTAKMDPQDITRLAQEIAKENAKLIAK